MSFIDGGVLSYFYIVHLIEIHRWRLVGAFGMKELFFRLSEFVVLPIYGFAPPVVPFRQMLVVLCQTLDLGLVPPVMYQFIYNCMQPDTV